MIKSMTVEKSLRSIPRAHGGPLAPGLGMTSLASMAICMPVYKHVHTKLIKNLKKTLRKSWGEQSQEKCLVSIEGLGFTVTQSVVGTSE